MPRLLLDTDVFVDHIRRRQEIRPRAQAISYSSVTRAELWAAGNEAVVRRILEPFMEIGVGRAIAERAGRIRRTAAVALPDALIAATALEHGLVLVTRNAADFVRIPKLRVRPEP